MRPLRLHLKGFTAFRDPVEIDFTKLDVFAISGPTGSGKSSLLDAMTYALYGRVERIGDRVGQLVSQGQPRLSVTLEFEVGRDRYRVTRSTPADRGATKILLERQVDDDWRQAGDGADRVREAGSMIARAIGLTYDGFTRSVLLPQGRFAEFLVGEAKKRREILTELLGLALFRRMAERAGAMGKEASVRADTMTGLLERDYAGTTPEALKQARAAARRAEKRERALATAAETVLEVLERWQESRRSAEELRQCLHDAHRAAEEARGVADELIELGDRLGDADELVASAAARSAAAAASLEAAEVELRGAEAILGSPDGLSEARLIAHGLAEAARARTKKGRERDEAVERAGAVARTLETREAKASRCRNDLGSREAELARAEARLEQARHGDLVAAVSAGLAAGDPCPVCGRPLEKAPRRAAAGALHKAEAGVAVAREKVAAAREAVSHAERAVETVRRDAAAGAERRARLAEEIEEIDAAMAEGRVRLGGVLGEESVEDPGAEVERRLAEWQRLDRTEREATREHAQAEQARLKAQQERERLTGQIDRRRERLAIDRSSLFERAVRASAGKVSVPALPPPPEGADVGALRRHAAGTAEVLDGLAGALARELAEQGSAEDRLLEEAARGVGSLVEAAGSLDEMAASVAAACRAATAEVATRARDVEDLETRLRRKKQLTEEVQQLDARGRLFKALALELRADRLIAFLQAEALQVLAAAGSERLAALSDGRYRLACRDDEFLVVDTWNGDEERSVRTLSGGETFLASLALALALADQVRSLAVTDRARLDSLFLDEGFGALDPDTLRTVVEAIDRLAGDGRLVGVITHVQELAEQFPRIEVRKDRTGSTLALVL